MNTRFIGMLLSICLLLSACGGRQSGNQTESQDSVPAQTLGHGGMHTEGKVCGPVFEKIPTLENYYQFGNMQINIPSGNFLLYNDVVVFDVVGSFLYAYDLHTGQVQMFCGREICDHNGSACLYINHHGGSLEQYGGKLYGQGRDTVVKTLEDGQWADWTENVRRFWHGNGDLFTVNLNWDLQLHDNGTGEPMTILEDYDYYWNVVFDGYLYGAKDNEVIRVDLRSDNRIKETVLEGAFSMVEGNHIYYVETNENTPSNYYLYRCDMDGTNSQLLLDKPVLPASMNFDDEYFYFRLFTDNQLEQTADSKDIYRISKTDPTQVKKIATLPESAYQIYTVPGIDILFVTGCSYYSEQREQRINIYVMNTDGSNLTQLEVPGY